MKNDLNVLTTPAFIIGLCLLLLNDFLLKDLYGNWLTGKLSDFAGLFIFPLFWSAFFPKLKKAVFFGTAIVFIWWKSPLAATFIQFCNDVAGYPITRVVDYSDLIALFVLPFAYEFQVNKSLTSGIMNPFVVATISFFAFTATSTSERTISFEEDTVAPVIAIDIPKDSMIFRLQRDRHTGLAKSDSVKDYTIYQTNMHPWPEIVVFDSFALFRISSVLAGHTVLADDAEKAGIKRQLFPTYLPGFNWNEAKAVDSLNLKTDCFGNWEEMNFKDALLNGTYQQFDSTGKLSISGFFDGGVEDGEWTFYNSFGHVEKKVVYITGEKDKEEIFSNGKSMKKIKHRRRIHVIRSVILTIGVTFSLCLIFLYLLIFKSKKDFVPGTSKLGQFFLNLIIIIGLSFFIPYLTMYLMAIPLFNSGGLESLVRLAYFAIFIFVSSTIYLFIKPRSELDILKLIGIYITFWLSFENWLYLREIMIY